MTMALKKTAKMKEKEYPRAARMIINNTYLDNIVNSMKDQDEANNLVRQINHILNHGGFVVKQWKVSRCDESLNEKSDQVKNSGKTSNAMTRRQNLFKGMEKAEQVLGLHWDQCKCDFQFKVKVNFAPQRHKVHSGPNLSLDQVPKYMQTILLKRIILSQINGISNPLRLAAPFTMKDKLLTRQLLSMEGRSLD